MRRKSVLQLITMTGLIGFALACAEDPTEPTFEPEITANHAYAWSTLSSAVQQETGYTLVHWQTPLAENMSASEFCEALKRCSIELRDINVFVTIPRNALTHDATISVTAIAGEAVNFEFGPHGTQFAKEIKVTVSTADTNVQGKQELTALHWVYDEFGNPVVQEEIPAIVWKGRINFSPSHFSGYALAM